MSTTLAALPSATLERLRRCPTLELLTPGDPAFDEARMAWNRAHEHPFMRRPEALQRLASVKARLDPGHRFDHGLDVLR
jgi:hypothetical protein